MSDNIESTDKKVMPLLPLRGLTVFPFMILHFDVGRQKSIKALEEAMINDQVILLVTQKDASTDEPEPEDIYSVGTVSKIKQLIKVPGDTIRVLVEGVSRAEIGEFKQKEPFFKAEAIEKTYPEPADNDELEALKRKVVSSFEEYIKFSNKISSETVLSIMAIEDEGQLCDIIASNILPKSEQKQTILSEFDIRARMEKMLELLLKEIDILRIEKEISEKVHKQIDKMQKEYYLREQMKAIQSELGEKEGITSEIDEYNNKLKNAGLPKEVEIKAGKEIDRLLKMPPGSAEGTVVRTYLDWIFDLPWSSSTKENIDLKLAQEILDKDHYGLTKVKERIIEYLAVNKLQKSVKGPILCLVGPPGVGKTSIAKSIARAINRNYVRMSLGGVKDEAEIRGHRRTYVGAMPGRIISALKQAGSNNPLILMDEIDKMSSDYHGDPSSAMLEVLDAEQNFAFRDHYLEVPFDLSNVLFITTANTMDTIPKPLYDRMEVINISSYTEEEKAQIAVKYLIPKQVKSHGLKKSQINIDTPAVHDIINYYTREAGVRNLEREIANVCRKAAKMIMSEGRKSIKVTSANIEKFLGIKRFRHEKLSKTNDIGIATGLAWTPVGGETLSIEVNVMKGNGSLELTGQLGDVMKESAKAAVSFIRSRSEDFNIESDFHNKYDIHIHVPEGAIPKDGPSAGITIATAMISALSNTPVKRSVAMTGEITLRGRVLPIGGLKEKALAAHRAGISTIIIPDENRKDVEEIPEAVRKLLKIVFVSDMDLVLETALIKRKPGKRETEMKRYEKSLPVIQANAPKVESNQLPKMRGN